MPAAVRITDQTTHGGIVTGPGVPNVLIGGMPASVAGDMHTCPLPPVSHQPTVSPFPMGSMTVKIAGKPALRTIDICGCGAMAALGEPTVQIG
jgi:uncharacterized Zn-binding protein involved in type VI secretion